MVIHTIGDSHAFFGWTNIPNIIIHRLGAKLCFSIGRDGISLTNDYNINNGDTVIFCFGEIDCRCHVHKHITQNNTYKQIIDNIVDSYFTKIKGAIDKFDDLRIYIYNIVPPVQSFNTAANPEYPFIGSDEERKSYVLYFNQKIQEKCIEYNFLFFNIYDKYADDAGYLKKSLSDGRVHISNEKYIQEFITNNF